MATIKGGASDKLQRALGEIGRKLGSGAKVRVGFLEGATYPDGKPVALVAAWNEFGTGTAPPRPFFRNMIAAKKDEWPKGIATQLKATDYDVQLTLDRAGFAVAGQLRQSIVDLVDPPLAPSTIARKGFDKPLIDQGIMLAAVDHEVVES